MNINVLFCNIKMDGMDTILAKNLKDLRIKSGLNQDQLAEYLDIKRELISYYENNRRSVPVDVISKYAQLFGLDEYDLYEEDNAINKLNMAFAFRASELSAEDLKAIAGFKKIALNYLKIKKKHDQ
jgi:transcriptional regulator with XRE-family HTH domain